MNKGETYGLLTAMEFCRRDNKHQFWLFKCFCGNEKVIRASDVRTGGTVSCGCHRRLRKTTHGLGHTRLNNIWSGIRTRIRNKKRTEYRYYGGRGLVLSKRWEKFENFLADMKESYDEHCKINGEKNTTLDRINSNKGYSKSNCKWSTYKVQNSNKRSNVKYKGETATQASYRLTKGRNNWLVFGRLKNGWETKDAFTRELMKRK